MLSSQFGKGAAVHIWTYLALMVIVYTKLEISIIFCSTVQVCSKTVIVIKGTVLVVYLFELLLFFVVGLRNVIWSSFWQEAPEAVFGHA